MTRIAHPLAGEGLPSHTAAALRGDCRRVALILQGGGALGAFQAGAAEALAEAGYLPDWIAGISIGALNAAILAGNPAETRIDRLRGFWERISNDRAWILTGDTTPDWLRRWQSMASAAQTIALGVPGFFAPQPVNPLFAGACSPGALSWYDTAPLRETLLEFADFDRINAGAVRLTVGAVNVRTGNFAYFDSKHMRIGPEHVMASGALPPGLPPVEIDGDLWRDGGLVSNTPLAAVLDAADGIDTLCFQVDLYPARGEAPRNLMDVEQRRKDIVYSSRTRLNTDAYARIYNLSSELHRVLALLPEAARNRPDLMALQGRCALGRMHVAHLIYRTQAHELDSKDYEFSRAAMHAHWRHGHDDTQARLARGQGWLQPLPAGQGLRTYDLTRPD